MIVILTSRFHSTQSLLGLIRFFFFLQYAHAATKVLAEGGDVRDGLEVAKAIQNTTFTGAKGSTVALDKRGDRIESYELMNYVLWADGGLQIVPVGRYKTNSTLKQYRAYAPAVVWPGNTMAVPADYFSSAR